MNFGLTLSGELKKAKLGHCRVCRDWTVLPAFSDGRCFVCTTDERDEPEPEPAHQIVLPELPIHTVAEDVLDIFHEAQGMVPAYKAIAHLLGPNGRLQVRKHGLWLPRASRYGIETPADLRARGFTHKDAVRTYYRLLHSAKRSAGLCRYCTETTEPGEVLCRVHQSKLRRRYRKWIDAGLCGGCGRERARGYSACRVCLDVRNKVANRQYSKRVASGKCVYCAKPTTNGVYCADCREKHVPRRRRRRLDSVNSRHLRRGDGRTYCGRPIRKLGSCRPLVHVAEESIVGDVGDSRICKICRAAQRKAAQPRHRKERRAKIPPPRTYGEWLERARHQQDRLWGNVQKARCGCWLWSGLTDRDGYGKIAFSAGYQNGKQVQKVWRTHKLAYELNFGRVTPGLVVTRSCHYPNCCNPKHLKLARMARNSKGKMSTVAVGGAPNA